MPGWASLPLLSGFGFNKSVTAQSNAWTQQTSGTTETLWSVHFVSDTAGWAVGDNATFLQTTNGGATWSPVSNCLISPEGYFSVRALNSSLLWAGGDLSVVRSEDGGSSFNCNTLDPNAFHNSFFPTSTGLIWSAGLYSDPSPPFDSCQLISRITYSSGSFNEQVFTQCPGAALNDLYFVNSGNGWAVGETGKIVRITNTAANPPTFTTQTSGTAQVLWGIYMLDLSTGWAVGDGGTILKTTNGGTNWSLLNSETTTNLRDVHFVSANKGCVVGANGRIFSTNNGGTSWTLENSGVTVELENLYFPSTDVGYAVGQNGTILKKIVGCDPITVSPPNSTLPAGTVGVSYNQTFTQTGAIGTPTWSVSAGTLPNGLMLNSSTGTLSGMPAGTGTSTFTIRATAGNCTGERQYMLTVNLPCPTITVNPISSTLTAGTVNTAYSQTFTQTGSMAAITWSVSAGSLPGGLTLAPSTGVVSDLPTTTGTFTFSMRATDANNCIGERQYMLTIGCQAIAINPYTPTLLAGTAGVAYGQSFSQTGGVGTIGWSVSAGALPNGLMLASGTGMLSGTPTTTGIFTFTIRATDGNACTGERQYMLTINCPSITVNPSNATLTAGATGTPYSQTFTQLGGLGTINWSVSAGGLPTGLTLASSTGVLDGVPTSAGTFTFTIRAMDGNTCFGERQYMLTISLVCATITVNPASLPNGFVGTLYSQALSATGGTPSYTFSLATGSLPNGVDIVGTNLTGTPTMTGTFAFTLKATDSLGCTGMRTYTVVISGTGMQFYPLAHPVRLVDTRTGTPCNATATSITGNTSLMVAARGTCDGLTIPANAAAITGNITTVSPVGAGFLTLYPSGASRPQAANSNYQTNQVLNNVFTVGLGGGDGAFNVFSSGTTHVVIDLTGYFAPPGVSGLFFHPLSAPVRVLDTRLGQPACTTPGTPIVANTEFLQQGNATCGIPATALALVGNATTVGPAAQGFLTLFPADATRPLVASGNYQASQTLNSPFTVGLSPSGQFKIFSSQQTNLVVDVLGYYSLDASDAVGIGLLFSPLSPARLLDTRSGQTACFTPGIAIPATTDTPQAARGTCTIPATAQAIVGNATTVSPAAGGFLTFWPSNATRPTAATSNYTAGVNFNRYYTVGLGTNGAFNIYALTSTHLVVDVSGSFAP